MLTIASLWIPFTIIAALAQVARNAMQQQLAEIQKAGDHAWDHLREGADTAWKAMEESVKRAWSVFK